MSPAGVFLAVVTWAVIWGLLWLTRGG